MASGISAFNGVRSQFTSTMCSLYGTLKHDWVNLYKVLEVMEDGNGGEGGLIAKHFVADGDIKNFKATEDGIEGGAGNVPQTLPGLETEADESSDLQFGCPSSTPYCKT